MERGEATVGYMAQLGTLAIVGPGLIGGSVAAALRKQYPNMRILGTGRNPQSVQVAKELGLVDEVVSLEECAQQADLILLTMPVGATESVLRALEPHLQPHTVVTDAGSTKMNVVQAARQALGDKIAQFVPGHPIAGAEKVGPQAATAELYQGRNVILTPLDENPESFRNKVVALWKACGARVLLMLPDVHDRVLASVSHVPHFLSSVFMWQVAMAPDADSRFAVAGSGFRDFTRIAAGSSEVWRDIFLANREAVLQELEEVQQAFAQAEQALRNEDGAALEDFLERAALARRLWAGRSGL
ncbi:prephenate dehydrogenase/arogenate dehydrogenase family protein [Alcaligenaceae bacterium 429]|uniref:prephenate dehydrogenase n=1 Tax=Paenalcaligenes sp. Me52 TaxID=3392038 RepID=UPI001091A05F|nr:prephenate dehydrogenase/arogenate dehydrogenase family protein [Alcaligenaceae bacterium 429]